MNVLVTGSSGFIGRHLIERLSIEGHAIVAHHNRISAQPFPSTVRTLSTDIDSLVEDDMRRLFADDNFVLVHLAWHSPREARYAVAAKHIAQMAHLLDITRGLVSRVISLGSADEYGSSEGMLAANSLSTGKLSPYGWGKKSARELLSNQTPNGAAAFWLRPFTVYGENQHGNMLLPYAVAEARAKREAHFSDGLQERDFVHVDDVVDAIELALAKPCAGFHALNLGWGKPVQVKRVLLDIARKFDVQHLFKFGAISRRPDEPLIRYANTKEAEQFLQWKPRVTLEEGIDRIVSHVETTNPILRMQQQKAVRG